MTFTLTIPRSETMPALKVKVGSIAEASKLYSEQRDESMEGASTFPFGKLKTSTETLIISYNGKVWRKRMSVEQPWKEDNELVFSPYA